ncbi:MAG: hypothetical protein A2V88_08345 [Elusimicrobia bacterium RBG_16_66_12]|nr:MAG: hypothetical protein A2V88_08345 [Elusimicrobia bacterium RBG_16_66_12]
MDFETPPAPDPAESVSDDFNMPTTEQDRQELREWAVRSGFGPSADPAPMTWQPRPAMEPTPQQPVGTSNTAWWIAGAVAVVGLGAAVGWYVMKRPARRRRAKR